MSNFDKFRLDGKVAVVTGANRNIGLEVSRAFAEAGATVYMNARTRATLEDAASSVRESTGGTVHTVVADVSTPEGTDRIVAAVHDADPQAHVLVNNAQSLDPYSDVLEIDDGRWIDAFNVNVLGPYRLCRGLGSHMRDGDGGSIINMASGTGILPNTGWTPVHYGSTKAAMWMMTRYLAAECGPKIRVNALVPGTVNDNIDDWGGIETMGPLIETIPMRRIGHPTEVAPAALYLASDASTYTTGTLLFVNGGRPW